MFGEVNEARHGQQIHANQRMQVTKIRQPRRKDKRAKALCRPKPHLPKQTLVVPCQLLGGEVQGVFDTFGVLQQPVAVRGEDATLVVAL